MTTKLALVQIIYAIVSAKWAMELGFGQFRQLLWGIAGFVFGPLVLLILYVRFLYKQRDERRMNKEIAQTLSSDL